MGIIFSLASKKIFFSLLPAPPPLSGQAIKNKTLFFCSFPYVADIYISDIKWKVFFLHIFTWYILKQYKFLLWFNIIVAVISPVFLVGWINIILQRPPRKIYQKQPQNVNAVFQADVEKFSHMGYPFKKIFMQIM